MKLQKAYSAVKMLIILAGLSVSFAVLAEEPFMLITEEEYQQQRVQQQAQKNKVNFKKSFNYADDKDIPLISIQSPALTSALYSPIRVEINFKAADDANIQLDSLKVLYGWLNLDITDRIRQHAQLSSAGILANNINLPVGEHQITIEIMDTLGRRSEKEVSFEIVTPEKK